MFDLIDYHTTIDLNEVDIDDAFEYIRKFVLNCGKRKEEALQCFDNIKKYNTLLNTIIKSNLVDLRDAERF